MAINESNTMNAGNDQAIGTAVIVSGSVQAEAPDGSIRLLQVNGMVFADETIITGGNGKVSIIFNDAGQTQLDLGRMSEVTLDEDVYHAEAVIDLDEVALEVEQMQEALLQGDPTQDLPAPAAGPGAGVLGARGGGHPTVVFDLTADEVTPESGAETIGVGRDFVDPERLLTQEIPAPLAVAAAPPEVFAADGSPLAGSYVTALDEEHFPDGTNPFPELMTATGDLGDMGVDFGPDGPGGIQFGSQYLAIDNLGGGAVDSITVSGAYGNLTFYDNGTWSFNLPDNIYHPIPGATGAADSLPDIFGFTITDGNGTPATGTMTFNIYDDGPILTGAEIDRVVEEEAMELSATGMSEIVVTGTDTSSVDHWYLQHDGGPLTIDLLSELGSPWQDLNDDGTQANLDTYIRLFVDDGTLDGGDQIYWNDDSNPALSGDGSTHSFDSLLQIPFLPPGNYILAVGDFYLELDSAVSGTNVDDTHVEFGPYQLTLTGAVQITDFPDGGQIINQVSLSDGNPDENDDPEDATQPDAAVVTGSLGSIVNMGADNPGTFSIDILDNLPALISQGGEVLYRPGSNGTTIEAYVEGIVDYSEERIVFTLDIQPNGDYVFTLLDQLDHEDDGTNSENTALLLWGTGGDTVDYIDFSSAILAIDWDLDPIGFPDGIVTFTIVDDIPAAVIDPRGIMATVLEDGLSIAETDLSEGNRESGETTADDETSGWAGSLTQLFSVGADEFPTESYNDGPSMPLIIGISDDDAYINSVMDSLTSNSNPLTYTSDGTTLTATAGGNTIFTLTVNPDGSWDFDLIDQLDHYYDGVNEENDDLLSDGGSLAGLDFSAILTATDYDGDTTTGATEGAFVLTVVDDIPTLKCTDGAIMAVQEDALGRENPDVLSTENNEDGDFSLGNVDDVDTDTDQDTFDLSSLVNVGADEELTWSITGPASTTTTLSSNTDTVYYHLVEVGGETMLVATTDSTPPTGTFADVTELPANIFIFSVDADGTATFNLNDQLDHDPADDDGDTLSINDLGLFVRATDTDGDYVEFGQLINVTVENDVPEGGVKIARVVEEEALDNFVEGARPVEGSDGNPDDNDAFEDAIEPDSKQVSGSLVSTLAAISLINPGADEPLTFSFTDNFDELNRQLPDLLSQGDNIEYRVTTDLITGDQTLEAWALDTTGGDRMVFTLELQTDGDYTFTLLDQLDHVEPIVGAVENYDLQPGATGDILEIDFSQVIKVLDADLNPYDIQDPFTIAVEDDIPIILDATEHRVVEEEALDNLWAGARPVEGSDGNPDEDDGPEDLLQPDSAVVTGTLANLISIGSDELEEVIDGPPGGPFSFVDANDITDPAGLTSQGAAIYYVLNGNTLEAWADDPSLLTVAAGVPGADRLVFTLLLESNGDYTFTLLDQLDHEAALGENILDLDFSSLINVTDYDGDTVNLGSMIVDDELGPFVITVVDDIPITGDPQYAILANEAGNNLVADLAIEVGADEPITLDLNPHADNMLWDADAGAYLVIDDNGTVLEWDDNELVWQENLDGSWSGVVVEVIQEAYEDDKGRSWPAVTDTTVVFTVALEMTGDEYTGNYTVELFEELDGIADGGEFSLDFMRGGGNATERVLVDGDVTVTITAEGADGNPETVNWNTQGMGVGNNTFVNEIDILQGPGIVLVSETLIFNFTESGSGDALLLTSATFNLDHLDQYQQGNNNPDPEEAIWTAYDENGNEVGSGIVTGTLQGSTWQSDQPLTIDSSLLDTGYDSFAMVEFTAETTNPEGYRVTQVEGVYEEAIDQDLTISFIVDGEDFDHDPIDQVEFDVTFDGEGIIEGTDHAEVIAGSTDPDVILAGGGDDVIYADSGDDYVDGGEGDDLIFGEDGDDQLFGGVGDDVILGGDGDDKLTGGSGDDVLLGEDGADIILGGDGEDVLDGGADSPVSDTMDGGADDDDLYGDLPNLPTDPGDAVTDQSGDTLDPADPGGSYDATEDIDNLIDPPVET